mmetsp:Transcript_58253/g.52469  ORF Transcript_58253/g.52469 Transcript_58253/m.52469 type:complete len:441 (-) Transcript_58253:114-1436(-)
MSAKQREMNQCKEKLKAMLREKVNRRCADCGRKAPTWTSTWVPSICHAAVFVCLRCSGQHRGLSTDFTFVQSATIDNWKSDKLKRFTSRGGGNNVAINAMFEAKLPKYLKPNDQTDKKVLQQFIKSKYIEKKWYSSTPKKVKKKNTSQPLLKNKNKEKSTSSKRCGTKKEKYIDSSEDEEDIEEKKSEYIKPTHQPMPDLLSSQQMTATFGASGSGSASKADDNGGMDLFDDMFNTNAGTTTMKPDNATGTKQDIMGMFNNGNSNQPPQNNINQNTSSNYGIHGAFSPDFNPNNFSSQKMNMWNKTGNYRPGAVMNTIRNKQQADKSWNNNGNNGDDLGWNGFDDNTQNKTDSKSVILKQYRQPPSDGFMTSFYGAPNQYGSGQYVNNNYQLPMSHKPIVSLNNGGYQKSNYNKHKPKGNNNVNFSTVTKSNELFSEFKI